MEVEVRQWDDQAPIYDVIRSSDGAYTAAIAGAVHALRPLEGDTVLDAACGTGLTVRSYSRPGIQTVAMDLSMQSLRLLRAKVDTENVLLVRGNLLALPFRSGAFSKVLCANAIQHLPDWTARRTCMSELGRVARSGARVIVSAHNLSAKKRRQGMPKEGAAGGYSGPVQYIYRFNAGELRSLLSETMICESVTGAGFPLPYRFKLSPISRLLEQLLQRVQRCADLGNMLIAVGVTRN